MMIRENNIVVNHGGKISPKPPLRGVITRNSQIFNSLMKLNVMIVFCIILLPSCSVIMANYTRSKSLEPPFISSELNQKQSVYYLQSFYNFSHTWGEDTLSIAYRNDTEGNMYKLEYMQTGFVDYMQEKGIKVIPLSADRNRYGIDVKRNFDLVRNHLEDFSLDICTCDTSIIYWFIQTNHNTEFISMDYDYEFSTQITQYILIENAHKVGFSNGLLLSFPFGLHDKLYRKPVSKLMHPFFANQRN